MKNKFNFKSIILTLTLLLTLGVGQMWAEQGYNGESHVYLNVDGTTKYYKVSTESWSTKSSLPGTWGGVLKDQTFSNIHTLEIKGGAVGGWTENGGNISGNLYYKVTNNTTTPSSGWTTVGGINASYTTKSGNNCFRYKNDYSVNVTPHTAGTYYLHIKITDGASNNRTSYVKFTIPSYTVAGSSTVLGTNWDQTDTDNDMVWSSGTTYTLTKSNVVLTKDNTYEYKVAYNHAWTTAYPASNASIDFGNTTGHYDVTFTFNASTHAVSATATRLYAVIYNDNGKTSGSVPATSYHANGATVTVAGNSGSLAKTGYSFGGWNTNSSGTGTNYTAGSGTFTMGSSDKNLYAKWTAETTYTITIANSVNATTSTRNVGATPVQITAPDIDGYTFSTWSAMPSGVTKTSGDLTDKSIYISATKAATVTANYTEDLTSDCVLKGGFDSWKDGVAMTKHTGESTGTVVYCTRDFTASSDPTQIKIIEGSTWYGANSSTNSLVKITGSSFSMIWNLTNQGESQGAGGGGYNISFYPSVTGTYTFKYDYSSHQLQVYYPVLYQLQVFSADPTDATNTNNFNWDSHVGNVYTKTLTLNANTTYEFKCVVYSDFYGNNGKMEYGSSSDWDMSLGVNNCRIATTVAGDYEFAFTYTGSGDGDTKRLTVTYPTVYTVTYDKGIGGNTISASATSAGGTFTSGAYVRAGDDVTFTQTALPGYTFVGWYDAETGGSAIPTMGVSDHVLNGISANKTVWSRYTANEYTITLDVDEEHKGNITGATTSQTIHYNEATTTVPNLPTAANGYALDGYYTDHNGAGTKVINGDGTWIASVTGYTDGSKHWIHADDVTLYAYYKKAEITNVALNATTFEPVAAGDEGYVVANPTIAPTPTGTTSICWELLYDNDNPVAGRDAEAYTEGGTKLNQVRFSIAGLAAGGYKIKATLRLTNCSGTILDTYEVPFTIASDFTITVLYKCGDVQIKASTTAGGKPLDWTSITAPDDIFGYTFSKWKAGEGIEIDGADGNGEKASATIRYKASFNGTLTAIYTKKSIFYFKNTLGWSNVYVNFMSNQYWDGLKGSGNQNNYYSRNNAMSLVPGTTDIYYYEYSGSTSYYITFTSQSQDNAENFWGKNPNVQVVVPTRPKDNGSPQTDFGYQAGTNMFIPLNVKVQTKNTGNYGGADYYNRGYWVVYDPITGKTGYTLEVYNKTADSSRDTVKVMPFTFNEDGVLEAVVDLEAATDYGIKFRRDDGMRYTKNGGTLTNDAEQKFEYHPDNWAACAIKTTAAGDYVFTINCSSSDGYLYLKAHFPAAVNDFQVYYKDNSVIAHPSRVITARASGVDTISFFVDKDKAPMLKARKVNSINGSTGAITWGALNINGTASQSLSVDSAAVYNFVVTQSTAGTIASIKNIGAYKGNYYIRCAALNSKWDFYRSDRDHLMTYSSFSESEANAFGEKFSHYKTKWCKYGKNVKFCIANDYSPCISDTLIQDVGNPYNNIDAYGFLLDDGNSEETVNRYSANIRFMWNRKTNKISRAYVASSTNPARLFLVLRGNNTIEGEDEQAISEQGITNGVVLQDKENWMYEEVLYILPGTRFKLFACYAEATPTQEHAQYFRGNWETGDAFISDGNSVVLIGGSGTKQKARIIYDFKTNRLMAAWIPSGSDVSGDRQINADVLVEREHHEPAQYITFANESSQLSGVKTVYGAMKFNRWILNNRANSADEDKDHASTSEQIAAHHPPLSVGQQKSIYERSLYFISFPFDVKASEIFGFGHYWDEWYLEYYDGLNRAKNGYWIDSDPNWKYVTPSMLNDFVLKANEGYILGLDLDYMQADNFTFWAHGISTVELFFPSTANVGTLKQTEITIPALSAIDGDPYRCTINRGTPEGDRRVKDSYWRCLGVPSLNIYNTALQDGSGNTIRWTADPSALPFIYMWNKADNTLTAQTTSAFTFLPMHAYLVQNGGAITWTNVSAKPSSIVARRENEQPAKEYNWCLKLEQDSQMIDQTFIRMSNLEQVTDSFDFGQDMIKEFNKKKSNIYTYIGYEQVAANSLTLHTEQTTVVPVGVTIAAAGDYTFAMPEGTNGVGITLVDSETGVRTNLSAGMIYTLTLAKGDYTNRFFLEISPVSNSATDIELINGENGDASLNDVRKVIIDQQMYIIKGDKIYDARGAMIK